MSYSAAWMASFELRLPYKLWNILDRKEGFGLCSDSLKNNNILGSWVKVNLVRVLAALMLLTSFAVYAGNELEIGIWPYISAQSLIAEYRPVQSYLQKRLNRPVIFVTASDQRTFLQRTQRGEYRFVFTAPHFARYAELDAGYVPMLRPKRNAFAVFVVEKNSPLQNIGDLRGKTVTMTDRITMMAILGLQALHDKGLEPGRNVTVHYAVSHNSAVLDVSRGQSDAAVTGATIFDQLPESIQKNMRILAVAGGASSMVMMANPKVSKDEVGKMKQIMLDFVDNTPEGKEFIQNTGYQGLRPPTEAEMKSLDPLVNELKRQLKP